MSEPTNNQIVEISDLAKLQLRYEAEIQDLEMQLVTAKERLRKVQEVLLPEAMQLASMSTFTLDNGFKVSVDKFYTGSISGENIAPAFKWLRDTGNESIIKREIKCAFGKGQDALARKVISAIKPHFSEFSDKQFVHPQTLKAFIREHVESGKEFPMQLFGAYIGNRAKIAPPNK